MKRFAAKVAAAMLACFLSVPGFSQSTTLQDSATNPAIHEALLRKIERDKKEVRTYKVGHVIVGKIELEGTDDPEYIQSQMLIFEGGFFSDAVRDLNRPITFRMLGYRPVDAVIPMGAVPDESGAIDLGTIRMEKCAPSEFGKVVGTISLPDGITTSSVQVLMHLSGVRANTPHNGTEPTRKHLPPIKAHVDKSGVVSAAGLTAGEYYVTFQGDGLVGQAKRYLLSSDKDLDLGRIRLEKPLELYIEYIVARNPATKFNSDSIKVITIPAGTKWKSRPMNEWDLEFVQTAGTVTFNTFYGPCTMADLGKGRLADFVETDFSTAKRDSCRVPFTSGHVYLLNHQQSLLNHVVLFRVETQEPSADNGRAVQSAGK